MRTPAPWVRPETVLQAVSEWTGIDPHDLRGETRTKSVCRARAILYAVLREACDWSLPEIGAWTYRDHTSVMAGIQGLTELQRMSVEAIAHRLRHTTPEPPDQSALAARVIDLMAMDLGFSADPSDLLCEYTLPADYGPDDPLPMALYEYRCLLEGGS